MSFSLLQNKTLNVLERTSTQNTSGQVSETWSLLLSKVPCRRDIAPRGYIARDDKYPSLTERYIFFIDSKYKSQVSEDNRISCEGIEYRIVDIINFDSVANIHHIEIYCEKVDLGGGAGLDTGFGVSGTVMWGDILGDITDQTDLQTALNSLWTAIGAIPTGISSIVAGTNITIDNTDPLNPVISSSGGGLTSLGNGQATMWNASNDAVDWGGAWDTDIYLNSSNDAGIYWNTTDGLGKSADFSFTTSTFSKAFLSQSSWDYEFQDWNRSEMGVDDSNRNEYMRQYAYDYVTAKWEEGTFKNFVDRIQANRYPEDRNDTETRAPVNWLYTDRDGNFMSAPLSMFFDFFGTVSNLNTYILTSQTSFTSNGTSIFNGGSTFNSTTYFNGTSFFSAGISSTVTNLQNASFTNTQTGANGLSSINIAQTNNTTGTPNIVNISLTDTASNIASNVFRYQLGGTTKVTLNKNGTLNLDVAGSGVSSVTAGFDGGFILSSGVATIKRDTLLGLGMQYNIAVSYINGHIFRGSANYTTTSGNVFLAQNIGTFAPTSGTATFTLQSISGTINQTGGASGITRGLYIKPTLTAAVDFRALEAITRNNANDTLLRLYNGTTTPLLVKGDNKIGLFGATPVAQATTSGASATYVAVGGAVINQNDTFDGYTLAQIVKALRNLGALA